MKKIAILFCIGSFAIANAIVNPVPLIILPNHAPEYSLINSVDFHPQENLFCVVYTHNNKIVLYRIGSNGTLNAIQTLGNPTARLNLPQHAAFSPDGQQIVVANWWNQTLNVYRRQHNGLYSKRPITITFPPETLQYCKPHGVSFSPCGKYLAIGYGAASYQDRAVALFRQEDNCFICISLLKNEELPGIPKGITFTPNGTHLIVTFAEPSCLAIFSIEGHIISPIPHQIIEGCETKISRPEDVKFSIDKTYCAVSNSDQDTVTFYLFDQKTNSISQTTPFSILKNPEAKLHTPHGMAFSSDGRYIAITQFGSIEFTRDGNVIWEKKMRAEEAALNLYEISSPQPSS